MSTTYDVINPATELVVKQVKEASVEETDAIIAKAAEAFRPMGKELETSWMESSYP